MPDTHAAALYTVTTGVCDDDALTFIDLAEGSATELLDNLKAAF